MAKRQSRPTDEEVYIYTNGLCDVFAIALNRVTDWEIRALFSEDCEFDSSDDNGSGEPQLRLLHAWVRKPDGTAVDARGVVSESALLDQYGDGVETDAETMTAQELEEALGKYQPQLEESLQLIARHTDFYFGHR